jgi:hypothetical protein
MIDITLPLELEDGTPVEFMRTTGKLGTSGPPYYVRVRIPTGSRIRGAKLPVSSGAGEWWYRINTGENNDYPKAQKLRNVDLAADNALDEVFQ